jgi:hypothetical protein
MVSAPRWGPVRADASKRQPRGMLRFRHSMRRMGHLFPDASVPPPLCQSLGPRLEVFRRWRRNKCASDTRRNGPRTMGALPFIAARKVAVDTGDGALQPTFPGYPADLAAFAPRDTMFVSVRLKMACTISTWYPSPPRKRGSKASAQASGLWIPAFAGMENNVLMF